MITKESIIPYVGTDSFKFLSKMEDVKSFLKSNKIPYTEEIQSNKGCVPDVPWTLLHVKGSITLIFAKERLWEIYLEKGFSGQLPNGVKIGMPLLEAQKMDPTLKFDEWNEEFQSENGYWLEDDLDDGTVLSITIYIKEVENDDAFYSYRWAE